MTGEIILGVKLVSNQCQLIRIENVDLEGKVYLLKDEAAKRVNVKKQDIDFIYRGMVLEDDISLSSYNVKPGGLIHVLQKRVKTEAPAARTFSEVDIQQLVIAFKTFTHTASCRTALQRLSRPEVLENIIAATPGLSEDPIALSIIRDPELIVQLSDVETVRKIAQKHPSLLEAAHHIAAHVHEEAANISQNQASTSTGYSYSLDALSDDEEMDSPSSEGSPRTAVPLQRNASYNAITAAQLAAAIANVTNSSFDSQISSTAPSTPNSASSVITSEMFSNAIQQAFASSPAFGSNSSPFFAPVSSPSPADAVDTVISRWQSQLRQMHEMGLTNDIVNVRALQTTSGDVQAAIELVLSGAFD
ncbi:ubiquitin-like protein 7 [Agrilus planipennis]|uniref:Ubiquitin-like protein 7 n=1 Tax=Agrilus planipennis TaxID=224129 RepID=A0A1W4X180_AGRPL|nr:ubiquitin-like protein 7 [Agrilus planipennis]